MAKEHTLNTYLGYPEQHAAVVTELQAAMQGEPKDGKHELVVLFGPMRCGKSRALIEAAGMPADTKPENVTRVGSRELVKFADIDDAIAMLESNPESLQEKVGGKVTGKIICFSGEAGEAMLNATKVKNMPALLEKLEKLQQVGPVFLDVGATDTVMFPKDYRPGDERLAQIAERRINEKEEKLNILSTSGGGVILALDRDPDKVFNTLQEMAVTQDYKGRKEIPLPPQPDPVLEFTDEALFQDLTAKYKELLAEYQGRDSRASLRDDLTRGLMANFDGPGMIEIMDNLSNGKDQEARKKFDELYVAVKVPDKSANATAEMTPVGEVDATSTVENQARVLLKGIDIKTTQEGPPVSEPTSDLPKLPNLTEVQPQIGEQASRPAPARRTQDHQELGGMGGR